MGWNTSSWFQEKHVCLHLWLLLTLSGLSRMLVKNEYDKETLQICFHDLLFKLLNNESISLVS